MGLPSLIALSSSSFITASITIWEKQQHGVSTHVQPRPNMTECTYSARQCMRCYARQYLQCDSLWRCEALVASRKGASLWSAHPTGTPRDPCLRDLLVFEARCRAQQIRPKHKLYHTKVRSHPVHWLRCESPQYRSISLQLQLHQCIPHGAASQHCQGPVAVLVG